MDSRLSTSEACRETRHSFTCCCLPLTCTSQWFVTEPSKLLVCMDQPVRNVGSEGRSNDALRKIYTMVIHSLSIRRGCCGCVMKTNGDVAVLQQLCMQPHPSPSEWDLLAITGRGRRGSLTCHCSYTSTSGSCSCSVNLKRLCVIFFHSWQCFKRLVTQKCSDWTLILTTCILKHLRDIITYYIVKFFKRSWTYKVTIYITSPRNCKVLYN